MHHSEVDHQSCSKVDVHSQHALHPMEWEELCIYQHLLYRPEEGSQSTVYVGCIETEVSTCGWSDLPCLSITQGRLNGVSASTVKIAKECTVQILLLFHSTSQI